MLGTGTGLVYHSSELKRLGYTSHFHQAVSMNLALTQFHKFLKKMKPESKTFGTVTILMAS